MKITGQVVPARNCYQRKKNTGNLFWRYKEVEAKDWKDFLNHIAKEQILEIWNEDEKETCWVASDSLNVIPVVSDTVKKVVYWEVKPYNEGGRSCVDYMNPEAISCFLEKTHEKYKRELPTELFDLVEGFFMDETRFYYCYPWTVKFPQEFERRKGYPILGNLIKLFGNGREQPKKWTIWMLQRSYIKKLHFVRYIIGVKRIM